MTEETENIEIEADESVAAESQPAEPAENEEPTAEGESAAAAADDSDTEASAGLTPESPAEEAAEPPAQSEPKKKGKRLPRSERPKKGRRVHTPAAERKPIVRLPKPEHERGRTQERRGVVVSSAMDKTIVVKVDVIKSHPRYKKVVRHSVKFHAHDEQNSANVGDVVRIVETRPLSATKRWRLAEIVEAAK
ncbi:MAG: 30S ribosomal protein S17 [Actinobacteria bacterium]|nr:30S ribosomal protein S17 [Actinomycetota bacterium]